MPCLTLLYAANSFSNAATSLPSVNWQLSMVQDRGIDFRLDCKVLGLEVDEGNHAIFSCGAWAFWM
jgi:hypothetical protein